MSPRVRSLVLVCWLWLSGCMVSARTPTAAAADRGGTVDPDATAQLVVDQTNAFRRQQGRGALRVESTLAATAADFAGYMARTGRFGHTADGSEPADRAVAHGYAYCIIAENIGEYRAPGLDSRRLADELVRGWQRSPEHRENLLDPDISEIGVGIARNDTTGSYLGVQLFGRPKSDSISFTITNRTAAAVSYRLNDESFSLPPGTIRTHQTCGTTSLKLGNAVRSPSDGERLAIVSAAGGGLRLAEDN